MATAAPMTSTRWAIDPAHSLVEFSIKHMMISTVKGRFNTLSGTITFDGQDLTSGSAEVTLDVASIDTNQEQRDAHLRTPDFFHADAHPTIAFRSTRVEHVQDDEYRVHGDLTMHGITRPVTLDTTYEGQVVDHQGNQRVGFAATTTLLRKDFGLNVNMVLDAGALVLGEKVKVELHLEAVRQG